MLSSAAAADAAGAGAAAGGGDACLPLRGGPLDQFKNFRIRHGRAPIRVPIPALSGLLAEPSHRHELIGDQRSPQIGLLELAKFLAHPPGDVEAAHVVHREDAHGHSPIGEHAIDVGRGRPVLDEKLRPLAIFRELHFMRAQLFVRILRLVAHRVLGGFEAVDLALDLDQLDADFFHLLLRHRERFGKLGRA